MSLKIHLSPEFGWAINDQHVYGPGSVFQGFVTVKNNCSTVQHFLIRVARIKLTFSSIETIIPFTISPGIVRGRRKSIFSVSKILWDSNRDLTSTPVKSEYTFPFIVQMPMVQFPPSVKHSNYKCEYKLVAAADMGKNTICTEVPVLCMPLIETSLLKSPMLINTATKDQEISAFVKLYAQDFVPGDYLNASLKLRSSPSKKHQNVTVITELHQTVNILAFDDVPDQVKIIASRTQVLNMEFRDKSYGCNAEIKLLLPADLTPSFLGNLASISYNLHIRVEYKGLLGGIWKQSSNIVNFQVAVGTLGYGIRPSNLLKGYSSWSCSSSSSTGNETEHMPLPKFMQDIEYEEALPLYESSDLPCYEVAITPT